MKLILGICITLFTLSANGSSLYAYSDHYEDIHKLFAASTLVVRGTVKKRLPTHHVQRVYKKSPDISRPDPLMTPFKIKDLEILRWQVEGKENKKHFKKKVIKVLQAGGISQHYDNIIFGAPLMEEGAEVLLFLTPHINPGGQSNGWYVITGLNDGVFLIEGDLLVKIEGSENGVPIGDRASADGVIRSLDHPPPADEEIRYGPPPFND